MKKNLISILILALMVVNLVLTAIMMFSVMGTAKKNGSACQQHCKRVKYRAYSFG